MSGWFLKDVVEQKTAETDLCPSVKVPKKFKVILLNDDYTPMEFVVGVLKMFFHFNEQLATQVMLQVHIVGRAVCGVFTRDIAETKVAQVNEFSKAHEHPLLCTMEPE